MPDPASATTIATLTAGTVAVPVLTAFGVPLGLRPDLLVAGFGGSLAAIVLLNTVPSSGDTVLNLVRTTLRRMAVAVVSSLTAGYLTPLAMLVASVPEPLLLGSAFAVGGGAQRVLAFLILRFSGKTDPVPTPASGETP